MKRLPLLLLVLFSFLTIAAVFPRKTRPLSHHVRHDPYRTPAAWRWRQCQHSHWRACLLQH